MITCFRHGCFQTFACVCDGVMRVFVSYFSFTDTLTGRFIRYLPHSLMLFWRCAVFCLRVFLCLCAYVCVCRRTWAVDYSILLCDVVKYWLVDCALRLSCRRVATDCANGAGVVAGDFRAAYTKARLSL